jgi:hypothetical protein
MYARQASTMHLCEFHARVHGPLRLLGAVCRNQDVFEHLYSSCRHRHSSVSAALRSLSLISYPVKACADLGCLLESAVYIRRFAHAEKEEL